jgi:hypothetical protein
MLEAAGIHQLVILCAIKTACQRPKHLTLIADQHGQGDPGHHPERAAQGERRRKGRRHPRGHSPQDGRRHAEEAAERLRSSRGDDDKNHK